MAAMGERQGAQRLNPGREVAFPRLANADYEVTSAETPDYNCIAYAAGDTSRNWDCPVFPVPGYYWPPGARRGEDLGALASAFEAIGYEPCDSPNLEEGFEKVALYVDEYGVWQHAAKQIEGGQWSSKLGRLEDIRHADVNDVWCPDYGKAVCYMRRNLASSPPVSK